MTHTLIVLFGGRSDERRVSVASAQNIVRALGTPLCWFESPGGGVYDVGIAELLAHRDPFIADYVPSRPAIWPDLEQALDTLPVENPLFVLALHGGAGEDGTVQRMLESRGLPFTGSGSDASAAAFDKGRAKELVRGRLHVAESRLATTPAELRIAADELLALHRRIVLKPLAGGSSCGLFFLDRDDDGDAVAKVMHDAGALGVAYIVEEFLDGRELTVGVIDQGDGPLALPVIEIEVDAGQAFDYAGKYLGQGTREICPANIPPALAAAAQHAAVTAHVALGCAGYSRTDLIADVDGGVSFLETNTLPGLTTSSLVPQELQSAGIAFHDFLQRQIELAALRASEERRGMAGSRAYFHS